jgi:HSP20 family protein
MADDVREFFAELSKTSKGEVVYEHMQAMSHVESSIEETAGEGQLSVDMYKTHTALVLEAPIGGVRSEDVEIEVTTTSVSIKGKRHRDHRTEKRDYIVDECHWGRFSREISLPVEVNADKADATVKNGVLRVVMPLLGRQGHRKIGVSEA